MSSNPIPRNSARPWWMSACLLLLLAFSGCDSTPTARPADVVDVLHPDSSATLEVAVGQVVALDLPGHAGTGYVWRLGGECPAELEFLDGPVFTPDDPGRAGSRGFSRFRFRVNSSGKARLSFDYVRSWQEDARPVRRSTIELDASSDR